MDEIGVKGRRREGRSPEGRPETHTEREIERERGFILRAFGNLNDRSRRMDRESALRLNAKLHVAVSKLPAVIRDETHIHTTHTHTTHFLSLSVSLSYFFRDVSQWKLTTWYIVHWYLLGLAESTSLSFDIDTVLQAAPAVSCSIGPTQSHQPIRSFAFAPVCSSGS